MASQLLRVSYDTANLRQTPELRTDLANVAAVVKKGTAFTEFERAGDDWYRVSAYLHDSVVGAPVMAPPDDYGVPYTSQWDDEANQRGSDCGQACVKMVAASRGVVVNVNDIRVGAANGMSDQYDLVEALTEFGIKARVTSGKSLDQLSHAAIVLVGYKYLSGRQDTYAGQHWLVFIGLNGEDVIAHDPDFWGGRRNEGCGKRYRRQEFEAAFSNAWGAGGFNRVAVELV